MDISKVSHGTEESELAYSQVLKEFSKTIIFLAVIAPFGIVGNVATICFYSKDGQKPINFFINALAVTDLAVSSMAFVAIAETALNIKLHSNIVCKSLWFLYYFFIGSSITLASVIAVERYRRVCKPTSRQITLRDAKLITAVSVLCMMLLSFRAYLTVDVVASQLELESFPGRASADSGSLFAETSGNPRRDPAKRQFERPAQFVPDRDDNDTEESVENITQVSRTPSCFTDSPVELGMIASTPVIDVPSNLSNLSSKVILVSICSFTRDSNLSQYVMLFHICDVGIVLVVILNFLFCYASVIRTLVVHIQSTGWLHQKESNARKKVNVKRDVPGASKSKEDSTTEKRLSQVRRYTVQSEEPPVLTSFSVVKNELLELCVTGLNDTSGNGGTGSACRVSKLSTPTEGKEMNACDQLSESLSSNSKPEISCDNPSYSKTAGPVMLKNSKCVVVQPKATPMAQMSTGTYKNESSQVNMKRSERQMTIAMLVVSVGLLISFVPYFISTISIQFLSTEDNSLNGTANLMIRCVFINSIINCFIYYVFSTPYRKYINDILTGMLFCRRN